MFPLAYSQLSCKSTIKVKLSLKEINYLALSLQEINCEIIILHNLMTSCKIIIFQFVYCKISQAFDFSQEKLHFQCKTCKIYARFNTTSCNSCKKNSCKTCIFLVRWFLLDPCKYYKKNTYKTCIFLARQFLMDPSYKKYASLTSIFSYKAARSCIKIYTYLASLGTKLKLFLQDIKIMQWSFKKII